MSNFKTWNAPQGEVLDNGNIYLIFIYSHTANLSSLRGFFCQLKIANSVRDISNSEHFKYWLLKVFLLVYTCLLCKRSLKNQKYGPKKVSAHLKLFFLNIFTLRRFFIMLFLTILLKIVPWDFTFEIFILYAPNCTQL